MSDRNVVVMQRETSMPTLRAHLRRSGVFVPPAFARPDWGPPLINETPHPGPVGGNPRETLPRRDMRHDPPTATVPQRGQHAPQQHQAPPQQPQQPQQPRQGDGFDQHFAPTGAYPLDGASAADMARSMTVGGAAAAAAAAAADQTPPRPSSPVPAVAPHQQFTPSGMGVGESTTQASHRSERLDLAEWGYLLRIVMIADPKTPEPAQLLANMKPNIGGWLKHQIQQPARLEYDRRFRRDIEKQLAKFLTESMPRFPVIKADIQFIE